MTSNKYFSQNYILSLMFKIIWQQKFFWQLFIVLFLNVLFHCLIGNAPLYFYYLHLTQAPSFHVSYYFFPPTCYLFLLPLLFFFLFSSYHFFLNQPTAFLSSYFHFLFYFPLTNSFSLTHYFSSSPTSISCFLLPLLFFLSSNHYSSPLPTTCF